MKWRLAQEVIPQFRDRIRDVIEDELDGCAAGPFVLAHMDFNPWYGIQSNYFEPDIDHPRTGT